MRIHLVKSFIGIFALDDNKKVVSFRPFPKNANMIASKLSEKEPSEIRQIKTQSKDKEFVLADKEYQDYVKQNLPKLATQFNFIKDRAELNTLLSQINTELTKAEIKRSGTRDTLIVNINNAIEELDKSINIFVERLREFYSLHFPELDRETDNHENFAKLLEKYGNRKNFESPLKLLAEKSTGIEFTKEDEEIARELAKNVINQYELRENLAKYMSSILREIAPNFSAIAGDSIAAKLISKAGGLERLSKMPSSTIQLLGSEKALFRFLKSRKQSRSPKYGLIYNHPLIQNAPKEQQGKIARLLASKLSIAVRIDYYSKDYKADEMKKELEEKIKEIT